MESGAMPRGVETVLLVEDERAVREVAADILRGLGYTVLEAADGFEALRLVRGAARDVFNLLLTDAVMPLMSGWELADKIRESQPLAKVLYTSGYSAGMIERSAQRRQEDGFIEKPFTAEELAVKVRAVLER